MSSKCLRCRGVLGKRNTRVHTVASKFAKLKSGWLQRVEHTAREGVQNTHHWCRRPQTSHQNQNRVGKAGSRRHCCSCVSVASPSFSFCQGGQWSLRALLLILILCFCNTGNCGIWSLRSLVESNSIIFPSDFLAVVSYDVVRINARRSFNSQSKVVTVFYAANILVMGNCNFCN